MFSMRNFVKRGLLAAVGKQPDFWIILNAAGWADKGVLVEDDLAEIQETIDAQAAAAAAPDELAAEAGEGD